MLTEEDKRLWRLIGGIAVVVVWMGIQYSGHDFGGLLLLAALLQFPTQIHHQPIQSTWRGWLELLAWLAAVFAANWLWNQLFTEEQSKALTHSAAVVLGIGGLWILALILGWRRRQRASLDSSS